MALAKFVTITAMSWRLTAWSGLKVPSPMPWMTPASTPQFTAWLAQWPVETSLKFPLVPYWLSSPAVRAVLASMVIKAPRVRLASGEKVVALVPFKIP